MIRALYTAASGMTAQQLNLDSRGVTGGVGELTSSADDSGGALLNFGSEALAKAISEKGGLGIARRVLNHFEEAARARGADGSGQATGEAVKKTRMNSTSITKVTGRAADKLMEGERR